MGLKVQNRAARARFWVRCCKQHAEVMEGGGGLRGVQSLWWFGLPFDGVRQGGRFGPKVRNRAARAQLRAYQWKWHWGSMGELVGWFVRGSSCSRVLCSLTQAPQPFCGGRQCTRCVSARGPHTAMSLTGVAERPTVAQVNKNEAWERRPGDGPAPTLHE